MNSNIGAINPDSQDKLQVLIDLLDSYAPLVKRGFKQSAQFPGTRRDPLTYMIYDSEACRVKFSFDYSGNGRKLDLRIHYGRLHAPDHDTVMKWNGEVCYCWHNLESALKYLDGLSPQEAANTQAQEPKGVQEFLRLGLTTQDIPQPEWMIRLHATVWEYYGIAFFQLFDLRHPESWEQFTQFVSGYYDIIGRNPVHDPSLDKVC